MLDIDCVVESVLCDELHDHVPPQPTWPVTCTTRACKCHAFSLVVLCTATLTRSRSSFITSDCQVWWMARWWPPRSRLRQTVGAVHVRATDWIGGVDCHHRVLVVGGLHVLWRRPSVPFLVSENNNASIQTNTIRSLFFMCMDESEESEESALLLRWRYWFSNQTDGQPRRDSAVGRWPSL